MVPEHFPENLVSGAALSHPDDQHARQWSVCFSYSLFTSQKLAQLVSAFLTGLLVFVLRLKL